MKDKKKKSFFIILFIAVFIIDFDLIAANNLDNDQKVKNKVSSKKNATPLNDKLEQNAEAQDYFNAGVVLFQKSEYSEAIELFKKALATTSEKKAELADLIKQKIGLAYLELKNPSAAIKYFDLIKKREYSIFAYAIYFFKTDKYISSLRNLNIFLNNFPRSNDYCLARFYQAQSLYRLGRIRDACYAYNQVIGNCREALSGKIIADTFMGLGRCYYKLSQFKKSVSSFKSALEQPLTDNLRVYAKIKIAQSYQLLNKADLALEVYDELLKQDKANLYIDYVYFQKGAIYFKQENYEQALKFFAKVKDENLLPAYINADLKYYLANIYLSQGKIIQAREVLEEIINLYPDYNLIQQVKYLHAQTFLKQGNYKEAINHLLPLIDNLQSKSIKKVLYLDIIESFYRLSDYKQVIKYFNLVNQDLNQPENLAFAYFSAASAYYQLGKIKEAYKLYEKIINNFSNSSYYWRSLFNAALIDLEQQRIQLAKKRLQKLNSAKTNYSVSVKFLLGSVNQNQGNLEQALEYYSQITGSSSLKEKAMLNTAFILKDLRRYQQAIPVFLELIESYQDSSTLRLALGYCLHKTGKTKEAIEQYRKVIYNFNNNQDRLKAYFRIARLYLENNQIEDAKGIYRQIIQSGHPEAKVAREKLKQLEGDEQL
jgi:tetratricopeptide (TPR) repeat protein